MNTPNGKYFVTTPDNRNMSFCVPGSDHIMIDYGCLIIYDKDSNILCAYASGSWERVDLFVQVSEDSDVDRFGHIG